MAWVLKQQQNFAAHLVLDMINAAFLAGLFFFSELLLLQNTITQLLLEFIQKC